MRISLSNLPALSFSIITLVIVACVGCENQAVQNSPEEAAPTEQQVRIVTLGGDVTESVFFLGAGDLVVGSDKSSQYPPEVLELPRLDYHRQMSAEAILSLEPSLVLLTEDAGPPTAIEQLESAGVRVVPIPSTGTQEGAAMKLRAVGAALDLDEKAEVAIEVLETKLALIKERVSALEGTPSVLFLYSRAGMGAPMIGGVGSGADTMVELAGGRNAAPEIHDFRPLTPEALLDLNPDVILMLEKGFAAVGGEDGLLRLPGMAETTAGKNRHFVRVADDLLLSFGPRLPEAVLQLADSIHSTPGDFGG